MKQSQLNEYARVISWDSEAQLVTLYLSEAAFSDFTRGLKDNEVVSIRRLPSEIGVSAPKVKAEYAICPDTGLEVDLARSCEKCAIKADCSAKGSS
jgi:hypothetical protein